MNFMKSGILLKGTVSVISSDLPFKEEHPRFTTVPFKRSIVTFLKWQKIKTYF